MEEHVIVDSSFSAVINAPLEKIDIPAWCFSLPDEEYQGCSPAHFAAGASKARDGRRMLINVEVIGGSLMVQHYVEAVAERHHPRSRFCARSFYDGRSHEDPGDVGAQRQAD